jgi:hypothetical protein
MSEKLSALGVPPDYFAHAQHFAHVFRGLGLTPQQIDAAIAWGASFDGHPDDCAPQFRHFCEQHAIAAELADLGEAWHGQVAEQGIDAMPDMPVAPVSPDDAERLQAIEQEMQKPRGDNAYWQSADLRDEYRALLERQGDARAPSPPRSNDNLRRAEIETMMRADRARYFRDDALQRDYAAILERESAPQSLPETAATTTPEDIHGESSNG